MIDEGVIKFNCDWTKTGPIQFSDFKNLNSWRKKLFGLGLIGVYPDGIGFGNISVRERGKEFIISGTQTGGLLELKAEHYVRILDYSIQRNWIQCEGPLKASSESLTHAMIYELNPAIHATLHIHESRLWEALKGKVPATDSKTPYGTSEMALEVKKLYQNTDLQNQKILVMLGHEDGIITFGKDLEEATNILLSRLNKNN